MFSGWPAIPRTFSRGRGPEQDAARGMKIARIIRDGRFMRYLRRIPVALLVVTVLSGAAFSGRRPAQYPAETPVYNGTLRVKAYLTPFNSNFDPSGSPAV